MRFWGSVVPSQGRNRVLLSILLVLALGSLTLKGAMGPTVVSPPRSGADSVENRVISILSVQAFQTSVRRLKIQSSIVFARRGSCTLSARDAFGGAATQATFAEDARSIGPIRYFYRGKAFTSPPTLRIHFAVIQSSLLHALGFAPILHVPLAVAVSPGCANETFGLGDLALKV